MIWFRSLIEETAPVIIFGVAYYVFSIEVAAVAMVVAMTVVVSSTYYLRDVVPWFAVLSTLGCTLFLVVSLFLNDMTYFMASDTVLDGILGVVLFWSLKWKTPLLQILFERTFAISDRAWHTLTFRWGILFIALAVLNEFFRLYTSQQLWVYFKILSTVVILLFGCYQFTLSAKERIPGESNWLGLRR